MKIPFLDFTNQSKMKWLLRVLSLFISITLWFFIGWDGNSERSLSFDVPVRYTNLPKGHSVFSATESVHVTLFGRSSALAAVDRRLIVAGVELREIQPGRYRLPVRVDSPPNVRVSRVNPQMIEFELMRIIERVIPIRYQLKGEIPLGHIIRSIDISPSEITLKGNESKVTAVHEALVEIPLSNLQSGKSLSLPIRLIGTNTDIESIEMDHRQTTVTVHFEEDRKGYRIPLRVPLEGEPDPAWEVLSVKIIPSHIVVHRGKAGTTHMTELLLPSVDITGLRENVHLSLPIQAESHDESIEGPEYAKVEVQLRRIPEVRTFLNVPVKIMGKGIRQEWKADPSLVSVTIQQDPAFVYEQDSEEIPCELYVDVTNVVSPQLSLPVLIRNKRQGVTVLRIEPERVTVTAVVP